jgi:hypothetical protein
MKDIAQRETTALQRYAAIKATGEDTITVSRIYIDMTGDFFAALVLDELMHWTVPNKKRGTGLRVKRDGFLWLAVNRAEWWERKRITKRQADTAIQKLELLGLIEQKIMLFNAKTTPHLRVIPSKFFELYGAAMVEYLDDSDDDSRKEIAALYEMMGIEKPVFYENVKAELQICNTYELQNGDSINNPTINKQPIAPPFDFEKVKAAADKTVDAILSNERNAIGKSYTTVPEIYQPYAKAFVECTGLPYSKKQASDWLATIDEWQGMGMQPDDVRTAVQAILAEGRVAITRPGSITWKLRDMKVKKHNSPNTANFVY